MNQSACDPSGKDNDDSGVTVVEMLLTLAISATVSLALVSALRGAARHESDQSQTVQDQSELVWANTRLMADIRGGRLATSSSGSDSVTSYLPILTTNGDGQEQLVEWVLTSDGLFRNVSSPDGVVTGTKTLQTSGAILNEQASTFTYYDGDGDELSTKLSADKLAACTALVQVRLFVSIPNSQELSEKRSSASFRVRPSPDAC